MPDEAPNTLTSEDVEQKPAPEGSASAVTNDFSSPRKKSGLIKKILLVIVVLLVLGGIAFGGYYFYKNMGRENGDETANDTNQNSGGTPYENVFEPDNDNHPKVTFVLFRNEEQNGPPTRLKTSIPKMWAQRSIERGTISDCIDLVVTSDSGDFTILVNPACGEFDYSPISTKPTNIVELDNTSDDSTRQFVRYLDPENNAYHYGTRDDTGEIYPYITLIVPDRSGEGTVEVTFEMQFKYSDQDAALEEHISNADDTFYDLIRPD